jgi:hypothetical protein
MSGFEENVMWLWFCAILLCTQAFAEIAIVSAPESVQVNEPFTIDLNIDLPPQAERAFRAYLKTLVADSPLPLFLEEVRFQKKGAKLVGRLALEGSFEIPLGTFYWKDKAIALPSLPMQALPIELPQVTLNNYMLPFPKSFVAETKENRALQKNLREKENLGGFLHVEWQHRIQLLLGLGVIFLLFLPFLFEYRKWKKASRPPRKPKTPTAEERLRKIKKEVETGKIDWTPLLELLNTLNEETNPLTAHELKGCFSQKGDEGLASASSLIEQYAYRPKKEFPEFERAVQIIDQKIAKK